MMQHWEAMPDCNYGSSSWGSGRIPRIWVRDESKVFSNVSQWNVDSINMYSYFVCYDMKNGWNVMHICISELWRNRFGGSGTPIYGMMNHQHHFKCFHMKDCPWNPRKWCCVCWFILKIDRVQPIWKFSSLMENELKSVTFIHEIHNVPLKWFCGTFGMLLGRLILNRYKWFHFCCN